MFHPSELSAGDAKRNIDKTAKHTHLNCNKVWRSTFSDDDGDVHQSPLASSSILFLPPLLLGLDAHILEPFQMPDNSLSMLEFQKSQCEIFIRTVFVYYKSLSNQTEASVKILFDSVFVNDIMYRTNKKNVLAHPLFRTKPYIGNPFFGNLLWMYSNMGGAEG